MKIIHRYILKDFFRYLVLCLSVLVFIYIIINLFDNLGKFLAKNAQFNDIIIYYLYLTPSYLVLLIPVASIMAIFFVFGMMTKHKELIAVKTSGCNVNNLFIVILIAGCIISAFSFAFQETVGVWAQARMYEHKQVKIDKRPRRSETRRRNFFYYGENHWVYFIRMYDSTIKQMTEVILWQISQDNRIIKRLDAEHAVYKDSAWHFSVVTARDFDKLGNETIHEYDRLIITALSEKPDDFLRRTKPLEEMNFSEITNFIRKRSRAGQDVAEEKVELNYRFSYPIITIIVLLITLPLSVVLKRGGIAIGLGISIVIAFLYWGMIQTCRAYGVAGVMNPIIAAWLPNIIFATVGVFMIFKVPR
ncbi:MAG: LptF/LptG family permease [candidate division WOR-3 bacterium]|nr:MAG: LptF/LptG family permease [candidate division WOR-3 bacterium]